MTHQIVEMFGDVVAATEAAILTDLQAIDSNIKTIHYEHGHYVEIDQTLRQYDRAKNFFDKKYPLIALFEDITETYDNNISEANLTIVICYSTKSDYKSADRYKNVFKPILQPICDELLRQIKIHPNFMAYTVSGYRKINRPYWGVETPMRNDRNIFSDYLDAIEINNLKWKFENC